MFLKRILALVIVFGLLLAGCGDELSENAVASAGGECPADHQIKGNVSQSSGEKIFHMPAGQYYKRTNAEECFASEQDAVAAGYRKSKR